MSAKYGMKKRHEAKAYAGVGTILGILLWFLFAVFFTAIMPIYANMSTNSYKI